MQSLSISIHYVATLITFGVRIQTGIKIEREKKGSCQVYRPGQQPLTTTMSEFDAVDMDALLDEALDELDDNDEDVDDVHDGGVFDKKKTIKEMTAEYLSKTTATNHDIISTQEKQSKTIENSSSPTKRVPFGPNPPPPPLPPDISITSEEERLMESFQQMLQELSPDKVNACNNNQNADKAGVEKFGNYLMEQIQSEFGSSNNNKEFDDEQMKDAMAAMLDGIDANDVVKEQSSLSSFSSSNNKLSKTQNDKETDNESKVREGIGTKIDTSPLTDRGTVTASSSNTKSSVMITDEEKILKGLFQGLMTVDGGGGDDAAASSGQDNDDDDDDNIPNLDNLFQGMMNLNKGNGSGGGSGANSDPSIPDDSNADEFLDGMMEQLLSKELMYEPMKQVTEKFPSWLAKNKNKLTHNGEWDQRNRQYDCFKKLVKAYEEDDDDTTTSVEQKTSRLLELMEQVQEYGQPPPEIIKEIAPGLELDEEGLPIMNNVPGAGGMPPFMNNPGGEDCRIM